MFTSNAQRRKSKSYMGTVTDVNDPELVALKRTVSKLNRAGAFNKNAWGERAQKRVVLRPRGARVKLGPTAYNYGGDLIGGMKNAQRFDVYVYDRRP